MKVRSTFCVVALLVIIGLAGCNLTQLAAFRVQMRAVSEFTAWEGTDEGVFAFKQPLLTVDDLAGVEVHPQMINERLGVLRYRRADAPAGVPGDYEIRLLFNEGKLAGLILPPALRDGLGRQNVTRLFALIGGGNTPGGAGMRPLPKTQLTSAGLFPLTSEQMGREAVILLMPVDDRNRPIYIKMTETKKPGYYSEFLISFKRR